ncbi:MAG: Na+/H+ antiporter NhaA, partial [Pseudomonadales bacterium]|nr:Na+/H+ antiporter NhaA [Pseudomonadales bacterium]
LLICALLTALLTTFNLGGVRRLLPYMLIGILLWCAMLNSGLHATLAGVILAFTIPVRRTTTDSSAQESEALAPAAERLHHHLHGVVAFLIVPLFALTNAAITIDWNNIAAIASHPVTAGVISGLVIGKWMGVVGASWLAIRLGGASLPDGLNGKHLHGIGLLAGIGFTMSIFVSDLAFSTAPEQLLLAKTGILLASAIAGVCGYCWLRIVGERQKIQP